MTFLVLYPLDAEGTYAGFRVANNRAEEALCEARLEHPDAFLAEPLTASTAGKSAIPGELARAIEAWNAMPKSVTVPRLRGNLTRLVTPYRKWKAEAGQRDYLLEQLVADVEATPFTWGWIRFPWLFGKKNGELNSEKLHGEVARGGWREPSTNGAMTQADYLKLSARVTRWRENFAHLFVGSNDSTSSNESFRTETGVTWPQWAEIQKQFSGAATA